MSMDEAIAVAVIIIIATAYVMMEAEEWKDD